ncbi:type II secretion system protein [Cupriavidus sp. H39]|uniref:type II secretion system protein n=1 Tax=Cupriavidus sp. H39 TaxID=3401635 RepID=UPI003D03BF3A
MQGWRNAGSTYLGLLILVAIIGVATAAALTLGVIAQRRMAEDELLFVGEQFRSAFESYYRATPAGHPRYPMTLQDLVRDPRYPNPRRHLRQIYVDPLTSQDDWILVAAPGGGILGVHSASMRSPIKIANFPTIFQAFEGKASYADWIFFYSGGTADPRALPQPARWP